MNSVFVITYAGTTIEIPAEKADHIAKIVPSDQYMVGPPTLLYNPHVYEQSSSQCIVCGTSHPYFNCNPRLTSISINPRPSWDSIWMDVAMTISKRSIDPRSKVGCIIVTSDNTTVLAVGYNGDQRGGPNSVESTEPGKSGLLHAEDNCLIKMDFNNPKQKVMYVTMSPCDMCAKRIVNGNIDKVVYKDEYRDARGLEILRTAGVIVKHLNHV